MPYQPQTVYTSHLLQIAAPGVENGAWVKLRLDGSDTVASLGVVEVSEPTAVAVNNRAVSDAQFSAYGETIAIGHAVVFDLVSSVGGLSLPAEVSVVVPYTTTDGATRRARQVYQLVDGVEYGGDDTRDVQRATSFPRDEIVVCVPGAEPNQVARLSVDADDSVASLGTPETSDASITVTNEALSDEDIEQFGETIPTGEAVLFDVAISAGLSLPAEAWVIFPYTTTNGDERRAKVPLRLVDSIEYGGGLLAALPASDLVAVGIGSVCFGDDSAVAFGV